MTNLPRNFPNHTSAQAIDVRPSIKAALLGFILLTALGAGLSQWLLCTTPTIIFLGLEAIQLWALLAALIHYLYFIAESVQTASLRKGWLSWFPRLLNTLSRHFPTVTQWLLYVLGIIGAARLLAGYFSLLQEPSLADPSALRVASIIYITFGGVLYLYGNYVHALQKRLASPILAPMLRLGRVVSFACVLTAGVLFILLSTNYDMCWLGWVFIGLSSALALEPLLLLAGRIYQPASLRKTPGPIGTSVGIEFILGSGQGIQSVIKEFESLVGVKVGEIWIFGFLKEIIEPVLAVGLLLGWLSTCISSIPLGSEGVVMSFGAYQTQPVGPGLHFTLPWPIQQIVVVPTSSIYEMSLGFDKDLSGPLLWTQKHVEGEQKLLVEDGESLLTVNVPIFYRISDSVAYLNTTIDAETALRYLAERKLIQIAGSHKSFRIMTDERRPIADALKTALQQESNRLKLGLEITFIGLKDIHPPIEVAPAYQAVVSAEEQEESMIDTARAYEAQAIPTAQAQANALIVGAGAAYTNRVDLATGDATYFDTLLGSDRAASSDLRLRMRYDVLDGALGQIPKTLVSFRSRNPVDYFLDLRPANVDPVTHISTRSSER